MEYEVRLTTGRQCISRGYSNLQQDLYKDLVDKEAEWLRR